MIPAADDPALSAFMAGWTPPETYANLAAIRSRSAAVIDIPQRYPHISDEPG